MKFLAAVYKSKAKPDTYLYLPAKDDFTQVPEALLTRFTHPQLVMMLPLPNDKPMPQVDKEKLQQALTEQGFYLQLPPVCESLLEEHRINLGLPPKPETGHLA